MDVATVHLGCFDRDQRPCDAYVGPPLRWDGKDQERPYATWREAAGVASVKIAGASSVNLVGDAPPSVYFALGKFIGPHRAVCVDAGIQGTFRVPRFLDSGARLLATSWRGQGKSVALLVRQTTREPVPEFPHDVRVAAASLDAQAVGPDAFETLACSVAATARKALDEVRPGGALFVVTTCPGAVALVLGVALRPAAALGTRVVFLEWERGQQFVEVK